MGSVIENACGNPGRNHPPNASLNVKLRSEEVFSGTQTNDHAQKVFSSATEFGAGDLVTGCDRNFKIFHAFSLDCFARFVSCNWDHDQINYKLEASCSARTSQPRHDNLITDIAAVLTSLA